MSTMTRSRLMICTLFAVSLQIIGLSLFVLGFFPVKPTLSGFSGPESYRAPGTESGEDYYNVTSKSPDELRALYQELSQLPPSFDRLIFMVVDGLPAEFVLGKDGEPPPKAFMEAMGYTQSLLANGMAVGYHAKAAPPTVTMPRLKAMVSGAIGGFLDVAFNFNTLALLDDNLLDQFFKVGWKMVMLGDETWIKLFPQLFVRQDGVSSFFVKDTVEVDRNVSRHLPEELSHDDWRLLNFIYLMQMRGNGDHTDQFFEEILSNIRYIADLTILHYLGVDHVGHIGGRKSSLMVPKLKEMDDVIKMIHLNNVLTHEEERGKTLLVVVSDHGMTDSGNHGGSSHDEIDSLALFISGTFNGSGSASAMDKTCNQVDIAPTLALLFGVPIPLNSVGVLITESLDSLTVDQQLRALELNSWQLLSLLEAQLPGLSCSSSPSNNQGDPDRHGVCSCNGMVEEKMCCLYSGAAVLHNQWRSMNLSSLNSTDDGGQYNDTMAAYHDFFITASEWLSHRVTDKPVGQLALGILMMTVSSLLFLRVLFCLWRDECLERGQRMMDLSKDVSFWSLDEMFVGGVVALLIISMGSSSMVEEEQYIWHFLTSTMFWVLFRKTIQSYPYEIKKPLGKGQYNHRYHQLSTILILLISGRIIRGWHQGGVNWTSLPDISKWLEHTWNSSIKIFQLVSVLFVIILGLFCFPASRSNKRMIFSVKSTFLMAGLLVLLYIMKYQDGAFVASNHGAIWMAQIIYVVLGILALGTVISSPWFAGLPSQNCNNSKFDPVSDDFQTRFTLEGLSDALQISGWACVLSWCLLQLLLQQPINSMPVFLLLLQIRAIMIHFSSSLLRYKQLVEVATLYFMGMAGHYGLGNTNTLATIDVVGAFIGISQHSTFFSGVLMFSITYASPMMVLLSLMMYSAVKERNFLGVLGKADLAHLLTTLMSTPCLVPLTVNSLLLTAYTFILLLMRNHLFIWSVFCPKYLYACATTACIYIGLFIVGGAEIYISSVYTFRKRMQMPTNKSEKKAAS